MEKVIKTPSEITPKGTPDSYGNQAYLIRFTDGTSGFFRTPKQDLFFVGQPAECEIGQVEKKDGSGTYSKIQRVQKEFKKEFSKESPEEKKRAFALSYAKDFVCAWINSQRSDMPVKTPEDVLLIADDFLSWLNGNGEKPEVKEDKPEDILPF